MNTLVNYASEYDRIASEAGSAASAEKAARPGTTSVRVERLVKHFGETAALHGVSLDIAGGELIALLGPSGSGKTTLLRLIAGLDFPTSGRILFGREDASARSVKERNVGFVFQHYALFRHMTVFENIAFGLRARPRGERPPEAAIRERVMTLLDLVQLSNLDRRYPAQLSGGQRQRVALARALAIEPRLLLLDEPFGALDAKVRKELRRWLRDIHDRTGHTTVFVTHDQEEALELADRVAILNNGLVEQVGTADEVQDEPASAFVMTFIGDAARIPANVDSGQVRIGERAVPGIGVPKLGAERRRGNVELFCRPWNLRLVEPSGGHLVGTVRALRRVGRGRRVDVEIAGGRMIEVEASADAPLTLLQPVGVVVEAGRIFPLDGAIGGRAA